MKESGQKDDGGKVQWGLLLSGPALLAAKEIVRVLQWGAYERPRPDGSKGYGANNWLQVADARRRYSEAAIRHILAFWNGESIDPDSGDARLHHLGCAGCCIIFMLALDLIGKFKGDEVSGGS